MKFCGQCGAPLAAACPQCGAESPPGFKFCGACGQPLAAAQPAAPVPPAPPPPAAAAAPAVRAYTPPHLAEQVLHSAAALEGERKQVTVLFCDLVSSTALAERLGAETMHGLLNGFFELALAQVHRYEGTINQFLGDGFMALFGAPVAHEDHARRAALAALGLRDALADRRGELGGDSGVELAVRMGLNTGWVVVGGIGDHLRMDYTAVGDTTNLAARLQQIAEPGEVLASEATAWLLRGTIEMEPLEARHVKGKSEPIRPHRLLAAARRPSDLAVLSGGVLSPFVGRAREVATLEELRELAARGEGQVAGLSGEAGSGKSRLLYELRRRPGADDAVWLAGRCLSYGGGTPYLPLTHLLRSCWGLGDSDAPAKTAAKLRRALERAGVEAHESLPYLLRLLGIQEGAETVAGLSPVALQTRTAAVLRQLLFGAGQGRLVVVMVEDIHWADETSEAFLDFLAEGLVTARALLLLTYRAGYRPRWIEKSYATQLSLRRLTAGECQAMMEGVLRRSRLPAELAGAVLAKADGNPFFVEELTRSLVEHRSAGEVAIPDTIQGVLMARIDRLPEDHKRLLQTASVLGREFSSALLHAVWEQPEGLAPLLADLKRWEFIHEEPAAEEPLYYFKHALTQEAVYQTLLSARRRGLHAAAGQAYEALHAGRLDDVYDSLAYHYTHADRPPEAVRYLSLFAERAARGYSHAEAARALREALVQAARLPAGSDRDRREVELAVQLAASLLPLARLSETLEVLGARSAALARLDDPALSGPFHFWIAHTHSYLGDRDAAARHAALSIDAARRAGDAGTEGKARYVLSRDAFWGGRFGDGIEHGLQAVALLERSAERWWQGQAYWTAGFHHYLLGRFADAFAAMEEARAIYQALADPRLDPSWSVGFFHAALGDCERGIEECRGGLERARDPLNTAAALGFLGYAHLEKGDPAAALAALEEAVGSMRQAGMQQLLGWFAAYLAEALLLAGRPDEARERAEEALAAAGQVEFRLGEGFAQRAFGRIALAAGDREAARRHGAEALASFLAVGAPFEAARTRLDLAAAALAGGDVEAAAAALDEARAQLRALEVPSYEEKAAALAARLPPALASPALPASA
jgi:class 3 adenylate cyclase/tetratricopeptide (TPR) repeat protein